MTKCSDCGLEIATGFCPTCHEVALNPILAECVCCGDAYLELDGLFCGTCSIEHHACARGGAGW